MTDNDHPISPDKERNFEIPEDEAPSQDDLGDSMTSLQTRIDLLIDGELEDQERKDLLLELNRQSDGWRFCAMAFLEAQMFRQALRRPDAAGLCSSDTLLSQALSQSADANGSDAASFQRNSPEQQQEPYKTKSRRLRGASTIAISLLTFVLGAALFSGRFWGTQNTVAALSGQGQAVDVQQSDDPINETEKTPYFPTTDISQQASGIHSVVAGGNGFATGGHVNINNVDNGNGSYSKPGFEVFTQHTPFVAVVPEKRLKNGPPQTIYVTLSNGEYSGQTKIPCYLSSEIDADKYLKSPPLIASEELHHIFQMGGDIDVIRENYIVPTGEGRHIIIPVDQVIVKYSPQRDVL